MRLLPPLLLLIPVSAWACGACRPLVMARIASEPFWTTLLLLSLPVLALLLIALLVGRSGAPR
jgi:hypothetical protein